jgi:protein-S-isoprenylcysteine O-methyltransferase Ste14
MNATTDTALWQRATALYLPLVAALLLGLLRRHTPRLFAACLLSFLWVVPMLLILLRLNQCFAWWTFPPSSTQFHGIPIELYLGWILLWGILPQLAFPRLSLLFTAGIMACLDLVAMPLCSSCVKLGSHWLTGEAIAIAIALIPALCIAHWTQNNMRLPIRAAMQLITSAMLFLFFFPELVFALRPGIGWSALLQMPSWQRQLGLQLVLTLALPGIAGVQEFAERGRGTPIPYDPPTLLVTRGIYRYGANPMQLSCTLVMLLWSALLQNAWLLAAAAVTVAYSAGIARWDETQDLSHRFGALWIHYRAHVHNWIPRLRPYHAGPAARLYMSSSCAPCSQLRHWIEQRSPIGLELLDADCMYAGPIQRMTYVIDDMPSVDGIRAMGRALEHLHIGWAFAGAAMRLPVVCWILQTLMDASGLGPRLTGQAISSPTCPVLPREDTIQSQ